MSAEKLKTCIRKGSPTIGVAVGAGMSAQAAEEGGADFLMALNAGHFRMQGCSSMAALMPYASANELTWRIAERQVLPRVKQAPVFLGVCAQDPNLNTASYLAQIQNTPLVGVTNFPSVGFIDGGYRRALEDTGLGFAREVAFLAEAHKTGLMTIAYVFNAEEALAMARASVDILCLDMGFAEWRDVPEEEHLVAVDGCIQKARDVVALLRAEGLSRHTVVMGGPVVSPRDTVALYRHAGVRGYVGGSTIERFPAAPLITQTVREYKAVTSDSREVVRLGALTGRGKAMREVFDTLQRVADTNAPVLILGESGTGKELAARELHRLSSRFDAPLVSWNCGALAETLAMSELFGHEKGAFTGATSRHLGRFEQAHGGTLFMDEVTELPPSVQASLLRVVQEREIVRVGGSTNIPVDVRLIAATNRDLGELIRSHAFRLDLFHRLSTIIVRLPPLRERREDIPYLVRDMAHELSQHYGCPMPRIPQPVLDAFLQHSWPGNIRELRNTVERCVIMGRGEPFCLDWLNDMYMIAQSMAPSERSPGQRNKAELRSQAAAVLARHKGNKSAAARELGVTRKTLYAWLEEAKAHEDA